MTIDEIRSHLKPQQWLAFEKLQKFLKSDSKMFLLEGVAGSGKTTLVSYFIKYYLATQTSARIACTATTNKAVKVLTEKVNIADDRIVFSTIHKRMNLKETVTNFGERLFITDFDNLNADFQFDFIIVDECSMISNYHNASHPKSQSLWMNIVEMSKRFNIKFIFVGDFKQIPPVNEPYCVLSQAETIAEHQIMCVKLEEVLRQALGSPIIKLATFVREHIQYKLLQYERVNEHTDMGSITHFPRENPNPIMKAIYDHVSTNQYKENGDYFRMLAYTNEKVRSMNKIIRGMLFPTAKTSLVIGEKLVADSPIMIRHDDDNVEILFTTSDEFVIEKITTGVISTSLLKDEEPFKCYWATVRMKMGKLDDVVHSIPIIHPDSLERYNKIVANIKAKAIRESNRQMWRMYYRITELFASINYAYALTVHKSQGSTFENTFVLENDIMINQRVPERNQILYTAFTRPSHHLFVIR